MEDSKTIQREEKESLGPYDSLKRKKVDDCRPVRGWRRGNQKDNKEKKKKKSEKESKLLE